MTATTLDLAPGPVLLRAADRIAETGLARNDYYEAAEGENPRNCPVCVLGAIAVACDFDPNAWVWADDLDRSFTPAYAAADALVEHLGLDPEPAYDETLGDWSDEHTVEQVVTAMRAAAQEVSTP
jgi:hypothetical protein